MVLPTETATEAVAASEDVTKDRIIDFCQQASAMLKMAGETQQQLNTGRAAKDMLQAQGDAQKALQVAANLATGQKEYDKLLEGLFAKCKRDSVDACEQLLVDITERLTLADEAFREWRKLAAQHDVNSRTDHYDQFAPERPHVEQEISAARAEYEAALAAASDLVPSPGVIQL